MAVQPAVPIYATSNWTLKAYYVWITTRNYCYLNAEHGGVACSPYLCFTNWTLKANNKWTRTRNYCYLNAEHGGVACSPYLCYIKLDSQS
jgi:hypothetical protein